MSLLYLLVLRLVHVVASVCWAGGSFIFFLFIEPTGKALAPTGMVFIQHMAGKGRFSIFMSISSVLTVLSGILLFWENASGQWWAWMGTGPGFLFSIGSVAGLIVFCIGMFWVRPRADRIAALGEEIQASGGPPTSSQEGELQRISHELSRLGLVDFVLLAISLGFMAIARYWLF